MLPLSHVFDETLLCGCFFDCEASSILCDDILAIEAVISFSREIDTPPPMQGMTLRQGSASAGGAERSAADYQIRASSAIWTMVTLSMKSYKDK